MSRYRVTFNTNISIDLEIDAPDEFEADDQGWNVAEEYLRALGTQTDPRIVSVDASLYGIGADEVRELP